MKSMKETVSNGIKTAGKMYGKLTKNQKHVAQTVLAISLIALPEFAFAQNAGGGFFCYIAQYFKQIVGTAALVAITMWAIEHIFGASKLHDIVIKVGVACAMVIAGTVLITSSGLTTSCVL